MEGPGNGRGREGQDIHKSAELLELFLMLYPEALFLVDDHQSQFPEAHVLLQEAMGPDNDVHRTPVDFRHNPGLFGLGPETVQDLHPDGVRTEAPGKGLIVLFRQDRRRHEDGDLPGLHDGPEGRPQGDFRLAESGVAADKAIHGFGPAHIEMDVFDGPVLVRGLLVFEGGAEIVVQPIGRGEGPAVHYLPGGIDRH